MAQSRQQAAFSPFFFPLSSILTTETEYAQLLQQTWAIEIHSELLFSLRRNVLLQVRIIRLNKTMQTEDLLLLQSAFHLCLEWLKGLLNSYIFVVVEQLWSSENNEKKVGLAHDLIGRLAVGF